MMTNYRNSSAHNSNILDVNHREVGSAYTYIADGGAGTAGEYLGYTDAWWNTQDFGYWSPDASYLVGVVYQDDNSNNLYDIGEGITGAIVEATDSGSTVRTATTRVGGGYELALPAGVHGIRVSRNGGSTWTSSTERHDRQRQRQVRSEVRLGYRSHVHGFRWLGHSIGGTAQQGSFDIGTACWFV